MLGSSISPLSSWRLVPEERKGNKEEINQRGIVESDNEKHQKTVIQIAITIITQNRCAHHSSVFFSSGYVSSLLQLLG